MGYPVLTLPFDITSQIFVYCLPPEADALSRRTEAPLLLTGICRDWRDTAIATHELWNTIHLELRQHTVTKAFPLLHFWLPRAGNLPLSMSLLYKGDSNLDRDKFERRDALAQLIYQYASHWTTIALHVPFAGLLQFNARSENFASLKKLVLKTGYLRLALVARGFAMAPKLRELHIISGTPAACLDLPWAQLETLRLDSSTTAQCLKVLALVPNAVNITCAIWTYEGNPPAVAFSLPRLESLNFILSHTRGPALLHFLTLPALQHLEVDLPGPDHSQSLQDLILRSPCLLRRLSVKFGSLWTADDFSRLFKSTPSLEELEIRSGGKSIDAAFRLLTLQPLLPNLRSMRVDRTTSDTENAGMFADFLETRWNVPAGALSVQLKSFTLDSPLTSLSDLDWDAVLRLRRLVAEGMMINIRSSMSANLR
jgi:hypothetical protein